MASINNSDFKCPFKIPRCSYNVQSSHISLEPILVSLEKYLKDWKKVKSTGYISKLAYNLLKLDVLEEHLKDCRKEYDKINFKKFNKKKIMKLAKNLNSDKKAKGLINHIQFGPRAKLFYEKLSKDICEIVKSSSLSKKSIENFKKCNFEESNKVWSDLLNTVNEILHLSNLKEVDSSALMNSDFIKNLEGFIGFGIIIAKKINNSMITFLGSDLNKIVHNRLQEKNTENTLEQEKIRIKNICETCNDELAQCYKFLGKEENFEFEEEKFFEKDHMKEIKQAEDLIDHVGKTLKETKKKFKTLTKELLDYEKNFEKLRKNKNKINFSEEKVKYDKILSKFNQYYKAKEKEELEKFKLNENNCIEFKKLMKKINKSVVKRTEKNIKNIEKSFSEQCKAYKKICAKYL